MKLGKEGRKKRGKCLQIRKEDKQVDRKSKSWKGMKERKKKMDRKEKKRIEWKKKEIVRAGKGRREGKKQEIIEGLSA